jgi:hypothetical protein
MVDGITSPYEVLNDDTVRTRVNITEIAFALTKPAI